MNQALAALRFYVSESSKFSPFYLLYNRDVVLPVDNLLKPRRKYHGEELHKITLQEQQKAFVIVKINLRKAKKRQAKYADRNSKAVEFEIGDPVCYKNNKRMTKFDLKWKPFYRVIEKKGPVTYMIKNQSDGSTSKVHAEMLRLANIEDWNIPKKTGLRDSAYVVPPETSESSSDSDAELNVPLNRLAQKYRHEGEDSDSEDDIPLMELSERLKARNQVETEANSTDEEIMDFDHNHSPQEMHIDEVIKNKKTKQSKRQKSSNVSEKDFLEIMKLLLQRK